MKITRIETIPVRVPLKQGMTTRTAHGEHVVSPYVIVKVHTDAGLVGLGEATVAPRWSGETSASCVAAIQDLIGPALAGKDPTQVTSLAAVMDREIKGNPFTKAAVEMALWDLSGKAAGVPLYRMLGGRVREAIPIKLMIGAFSPPEAAALAEKFLTWGARTLKVKVGLDVDGDEARVRAVRQAAGPTVPIGIDANCGWDWATARGALRRVEPYDLLFAEQPIPPGDPEALASLRRQTPIPIMADESVFTRTDAWTVARAGAADVLSVYPGKNGGIGAVVEVAGLARAAGLSCCMGSNLELGIGTAAMLHVAAALPAIDSETYPADLIGPLYHEADLLTEPLSLGPEVARVPDRPGLGVELDEAQIARWRQR